MNLFEQKEVYILCAGDLEFQFYVLLISPYITFRLLCLVGIQKNIHVVDVTSQGQGKKSTDSSATSSTVKEVEGVHRLPAGLTQEELHVPSDEKDVYAYYYINKVLYSTLTRFSVNCPYLGTSVFLETKRFYALIFFSVFQ